MMAIIKYVIVIVSVWGSLTGVAGAETLKCELHIASSLTKLIGPVSPPVFEDTIEAAQQGGVCIATDGRIAEKQFVVITKRMGDGSSFARGMSYYSFPNGDGIHAEFVVNQTKDSFKLDYDILSGSGSYQGAKGNGNATYNRATETTLVLDITFNLL